MDCSFCCGYCFDGRPVGTWCHSNGAHAGKVLALVTDRKINDAPIGDHDRAGGLSPNNPAQFIVQSNASTLLDSPSGQPLAATFRGRCLLVSVASQSRTHGTGEPSKWCALFEGNPYSQPQPARDTSYTCFESLGQNQNSLNEVK